MLKIQDNQLVKAQPWKNHHCSVFKVAAAAQAQNPSRAPSGTGPALPLREVHWARRLGHCHAGHLRGLCHSKTRVHAIESAWGRPLPGPDFSATVAGIQKYPMAVNSMPPGRNLSSEAPRQLFAFWASQATSDGDVDSAGRRDRRLTFEKRLLN